MTAKHYFASSVYHWKASESNLEALMEVRNHDLVKVKIRLWEVPVPIDTEYKIENFKPVVKDIKFIGVFE